MPPSAFATSAVSLALLFTLPASQAQTISSGDGPNSEYQWQTAEDHLEIYGHVNYADSVLRPKSSSDRIETTGFGETLRVEYGINRFVSGFAQLAYSDNIVRTYPLSGRYNPRAIGLLDPVVGLNARHDYETSSLRYGMMFDFGVEDQTIHANQDSNNGSGGVSITPFLGFEWQWRSQTWGLRASYLRPIGGKNVVDERVASVNQTSLGGDTWTGAAFLEQALRHGPIGVALSVDAANQTHTRAFGQTTNDGNGETLAAIRAYAAQTISPRLTLLANYEYEFDLAFNHALLRSGDRNSVRVGLRYQF